MDVKELAKLIKLCRKEGVVHYKTADFEFKLGPNVKKTTQSNDKIEQDPQPTEEDVLFWSSGGINA